MLLRNVFVADWRCNSATAVADPASSSAATSCCGRPGALAFTAPTAAMSRSGSLDRSAPPRGHGDE